MIEPSNNIWSRLIYKLVGHEKFDTEQIKWEFESKDPFVRFKSSTFMDSF